MQKDWSNVDDGGEFLPPLKRRESFAISLEKIEPIPLEEARDYIIVGPLVQKSPLDILSEKQRKLSLKLEKELQKILKKEYYYIS